MKTRARKTGKGRSPSRSKAVKGRKALRKNMKRSAAKSAGAEKRRMTSKPKTRGPSTRDLPSKHDRPDRERTSENNRPSRNDSFIVPSSPEVGPAPHSAGAARPAHSPGAPSPADPAHAQGHKKLHHRWRPSAENRIQDKAMNAKQRFSPADKVRVNRSMSRRILPSR